MEITIAPLNLRLLNSVRIYVLDAAFEKKYLYEHKAAIGGKATIVFGCHFNSGNS